MSVVVAGLASLVLLALNAFFVAAEFALIAARRGRIEQLAVEGDGRAVAAAAGLRQLSLMLAGAQLGITAASFGLGALAEPALAHLLEQGLELTAVPSGLRHALAFTVALSVVVFLHMVLGEMAPKSWAIADPERSALALARPFLRFVRLFRPAIRALNAMANGVVRLCGVEPQDELAAAHSPQDLVLLLAEAPDDHEATLRGEERALLTRALELSGLDAQAVMVPRTDIVAVPDDASVEELERVAYRSGRSRLPVYVEDLDDVLGIVHVKDLMALDVPSRAATTARTLARPALVTPESRPIEDVMLEMRERRQHLAIVVDEYGAVSGLVTLEDVLEELIGDFDDETDRLSARLRRRPDGRVVVPSALRPDEFEDQTGIALPDGPYETVAGFVIWRLGRIPEPADAISWRGLRFEVSRMEGLRVTEITLRAEPRSG